MTNIIIVLTVSSTEVALLYQTAANFLQFSIPTSYNNQQLCQLSYLLRIIEVARTAKSIEKMNPLRFPAACKKSLGLAQIFKPVWIRGTSRRDLSPRPVAGTRPPFWVRRPWIFGTSPCDLFLKTFCVNCSWDKSLRPVLSGKLSRAQLQGLVPSCVPITLGTPGNRTQTKNESQLVGG